jgi:hypothetical protein
MEGPGKPTRRDYQRRVRRLLAAIDEGHRRQLALAAHGVTSMGMRELERETRELRVELAAVVAAGSRATAGLLAAFRQPQQGLLRAAAAA